MSTFREEMRFPFLHSTVPVDVTAAIDPTEGAEKVYIVNGWRCWYILQLWPDKLLLWVHLTYHFIAL